MKQFLLLIGLSLGGMLGAFIRGPFVALSVYYLYAVLRPQAIWKFQMSLMPEFGWSFYVALAALLSYLPWVFGIVGPLNEPERRVFPRFVWPHRMMIGFSLWVTLSYLFANNQDRAWFYYQELLKVFLMYFLATQVIEYHRLGFATSRPGARLLVSHGHVLVNGRKCDVSSMVLRAGDLISVKKKPRSLGMARTSLQSTPPQVPDFLEIINNDEPEGRMTRLPTRQDVDPRIAEIREQLIIEITTR